MAITLRSLAIKFSSSAYLTRTTTYSCYNVIKATQPSFITKNNKFSSSAHFTRSYSCYNVIIDSLKSEINSLGEEIAGSYYYYSNIWRSIGNVINKCQKQVINGVVLLDSPLKLCDRDNDNGRLAFASSGGLMGGSKFPSGGSNRPSSSNSGSNYRSPHYPSHWSSDGRGSDDSGGSGLILGILAICLIIDLVRWLLEADSKPTAKTSIIKLQVGLRGNSRSLQKDLNMIAKNADTSGPWGYRCILQETATALLRNHDYCISCYSSVDVNSCIEKSQKIYNRLTNEERNKIDEFTLVNLDNAKKKKGTTERFNGFNSEYIVITIIVAASGVHRLRRPITNSLELKEALQMLASIGYEIMGVEVLWSPQEKDDILTKEEMLIKYPLLHPFK